MIAVESAITPANVRRARAERRRREQHARREWERSCELMQYTELLQRDHDRERMHCGLPPNFLPVTMYGRGTSPLTLPNAASLQSWHASTLGLTMGTAFPAAINLGDPSINWDANVTQNLAPRLDITAGGLLPPGSAPTYGLTLDGGLSYFQTGSLSTFINVPLLGRQLICSNGTYTNGNQYNCVAKTVANQTPKSRTLNAAATDSSKPRVIANVKNGYAGLIGVAGTSGALLDNTSAWAADVSAGGSFAVFWLGATSTAIPSSIQCFWSIGNTGAVDVDPAYYLGVRNGSGALRANRINDTGTQAFQEASTATTAVCLYTFLYDANTVTVRRNGTTIINALALGTGVATCDAVAWGCLFRNNAQTSAMAFTFLEACTYSAGSAAAWTAGNLGQVEGYLLGKYALP